MKNTVIPQGSVTVGGKVYTLTQGQAQIGSLLFDFKCKQPEEGFYDWTVTLHNTGEETSAPVTDLYGLKLFFPLKESDSFIYHGLKGDSCSLESYEPETVLLKSGDSLTKEPVGARSSNTTAFPYFDFAMENCSIVCGIGWSGQWKMTAARSAEGVTVTAGQRDLNTVLYPEESIRSVRILLWAGEEDTLHARQKFVSCHRRYASPFATRGADYACPIATQAFDRYFWNAKAEEGKAPYFETEEAQVRICHSVGQCEYFNMHWVDACWFRDTFRSGVGNYETYSTGFPNGLKPISDAAHQNGLKFIVWFEPVRAVEGSEAWNRFKDNPKQLIRLPGEGSALMNLGDGEVWQWVYSHIVSVMEENGIDCYREDFNIEPLDYLISIEEENRKGMAQMRFTEGIYKLWDALSAHFPGLFIDNCASGGRLLDVETCSRGFSLWQSDTACAREANGIPTAMIQQNQNLALSRYIPHHQGSTFYTDAYTVRSSATYGIACEFAFIDDDFDVSAAKAAVAEVKRMSRYWKGDFTPLTEFDKKTDSYAAYALTLSEQEGMIAVFRRPDAAENIFALHLSDMDQAATYRITCVDEDRREKMMTLSGADFENLEVCIEKAPGSMLLFWEKI